MIPNTSFLLFLLIFVSHSVAIATELKIYSELQNDTLKITYQNNSSDTLFISDPNHYGLTIMTENGGKILGNRSLEHLNRRLVMLYPKASDGSGSKYSFYFAVGNAKDIIDGERKVVVWLCSLDSATDSKKIQLERREINITENDHE